MKIEVCSEIPSGWDEYVGEHPESTAYHRSSSVLIGHTAFRLLTRFLVARAESGKVVGILPVVEQSSLAFGRFHSSLPFVSYGGILADDDSIARQLADQAAAFAVHRRAKHVELRHRREVTGLPFAERLDKISMVLPLPGDEAALSKGLGAKLRSQVRRAEREEPLVAWGGKELLVEFYSVFAPSMHALGTPVLPQSFFGTVLEAMQELASVLVVRVNGKTEAAALTVRHGDRVEVPWAAATMWAKRNAINMRMYWEMLKAANDAGAAAFDFGRSSVDSGTYRFKKQWGAEPQQLHWHYWLPEGASLPALNHSNPKYELAIRAWQRMPLWCANTLGPRISRKLP